MERVSVRDIKPCKAKFNETSKGSQSAGSAGVGRQEETLRSTPPIGTVQDLITIQQAMGLKSEAFNIEEKKDWATVKANVLKKVSPIKDLIREMKSRTDAVNKRTTSHAKDAKPSSKPTVLNAHCFFLNEFVTGNACGDVSFSNRSLSMCCFSSVVGLVVTSPIL